MAYGGEVHKLAELKQVGRRGRALAGLWGGATALLAAPAGGRRALECRAREGGGPAGRGGFGAAWRAADGATQPRRPQCARTGRWCWLAGAQGALQQAAACV
jgi:hypothetical protein